MKICLMVLHDDFRSVKVSGVLYILCEKLLLNACCIFVWWWSCIISLHVATKRRQRTLLRRALEEDKHSSILRVESGIQIKPALTKIENDHLRSQSS